MRKILFAILALLSIGINTKAQETIDQVIERGLQRSKEQALILAENMKGKDTSEPKNFSGGKLHVCAKTAWVSGFFPGVLWYLYEDGLRNKDYGLKNKDTELPPYGGGQGERLLSYAKSFTERLDSVKWVTNNHDVGFMINCSYGNGYRITGDKAYKDVLLQAAKSLSTRFNKKVGCIQSWGSNSRWQFPVIIDNMLNLELLAENGYKDMATSHAAVTRKNHFRPDYSTYHVVSYDTISGQPHMKCTHQGYADPSAWARGQGWALYGFTMMFRETGDSTFLLQARRVGKYIASRLPEDGIPYWDFDDPRVTGYDMPNVKCTKLIALKDPLSPEGERAGERGFVPRDASAAAVYASAYIELSKYVDYAESQQYLALAEKILRTLSSPDYLSEKGEQGGFILKHSVGNMDKNSEVDVSLTYADYYYVEALTRLKQLRATQGQRDRAFWVETMLKIARPVMENMAAGTLHQNMPFESVDTTDASRKEVCFLETFGRTFVGIAPWLENNSRPLPTSPKGRSFNSNNPTNDKSIKNSPSGGWGVEDSLKEEFRQLAIKGVINATDPKSADRLCWFHKDNKQPLVDAAYFALGLLESKTQVWDKLTKTQQKNVLAALEETHPIKPGDKNWTLFASIVEGTLLELGGKCDTLRMMYGIRKFMGEWYKGDAMYGDGMEFHYDYYNSIVIQPLLCASLKIAVKHGLIPDSELKLAQQRMGRYAQILERSISPEGTYPVTGRSITYRIAHLYALSQSGLDHLYPKQLKPSQARTAMTAVMRPLLTSPKGRNFNSEGWLYIGFAGHQVNMGEKYINTGSDYMCMAGFVALGLPATDSFWAGPELDWTSKKAWNGVDVGCDHALRDLNKVAESKKLYQKYE